MARRMRDLLAERAAESFVGRSDERALLLQGLEEQGPLVLFVHGIAGVGKSSLLEAFLARARGQGATVVRLDCRAIEPTERGVIHELGDAIGGNASAVEEVAERLGKLGERVVLALDTYEILRPLDTWLRQAFVPALGDNVRVVLSGREPPAAAWIASQEWQGLFCSLPLEPLGDADALELLSGAGIGDERARRINRFARGHPLALKLAASAVMERPELELEDMAVPRVVEELTHIYLQGVDDPLTRKTLDAASVIRRATQSLLCSILPDVAPQDAYERLRALPFVESGRDGLILHDALHEAIAAALRAADPDRYRAYRRAAWRQLRSEVRTVGAAELWRYRADMLYLIENPNVREAFFPSGSQQMALEPARPEDGAAIHAITTKHEGPEEVKLLDALWKRLPKSFRVAKDGENKVIGYYVIFDPGKANSTWLEDDPVMRHWWHHLSDNPVPNSQTVLFIRRWLSLEHGEAPSPVQTATWLDAKRYYMELRPHLRRAYATVCDLSAYAPALVKLGFVPMAGAEVNLDNAVYHSAVVDFGSASIDGWLAGLVAAELGVDEGELLDIGGRELVMDGERVGLTPLEFGVMHYLYEREGKVVTRASLVQDVWGYSYVGGSNVVDVVIRSLRKKLGDRSSMIETVTGAGYRFRGG